MAPTRPCFPPIGVTHDDFAVFRLEYEHGAAICPRSRRRPCRHRSSGLATIELPGVIRKRRHHSKPDPRLDFKGRQLPGGLREAAWQSKPENLENAAPQADEAEAQQLANSHAPSQCNCCRSASASHCTDPRTGAGARAADRDLRGASKGRHKPNTSRCMPGAGLSRRVRGKVLPYMPAFQPYRGKPAVRNDREGRGNVGIIRSPVRASTLPD